MTANAKARPAGLRGWRCGPIVGYGLPLLGLLGGMADAQGQSVLAPPSSAYENPAASQTITTIPTGGIPPPPNFVNPNPPLLNFGPAEIRPHLLYRFIYGDGIPAAPTNHVTTVIQEISPGILVNLRPGWTLDYTPTLRLYSSRQFPNSTDELAALNGATSAGEWGFTLAQTYSTSSSPLLETESLGETVNYLTVFKVFRQLGSHLSGQAGLTQSFRSTMAPEVNQDVKQWSVDGALNYQIGSRFQIGVSGSVGYDLISPGSDMSFEQLQGTANWQLGDKFILGASAGLEVTQLAGTQLVNPIFSGTVTYHPWSQTTAFLTASRMVTPSYFENDVLVNTSISGTIHQDFLQYYNFEVSVGYTTSPFVGFATMAELDDFQQNGPVPTTRVVEQNRDDIARFYRVRLGRTFRQRGTISLFYTYTENSSSAEAFSLTSTQVGLELGWRY